MITAADLDLHDEGTSEFDYAETMFLIFSVPEAGISGNAYVLARPNAGICLSSIYLHRRIVPNAWAANYCDAPLQHDQAA